MMWRLPNSLAAAASNRRNEREPVNDSSEPCMADHWRTLSADTPESVTRSISTASDGSRNGL